MASQRGARPALQRGAAQGGVGPVWTSRGPSMIILANIILPVVFFQYNSGRICYYYSSVEV